MTVQHRKSLRPLFGSFALVGVFAAIAVTAEPCAARGGGASHSGLGGHAKDYGMKDVDPVYGGGRGRDAYGASLNADPYSGSRVRKDKNIDKDRSYAELYGKTPKKKAQCEDPDDCQPEERRGLSHEDQTEQNRANKIAQRLQ